MASTGQSKARQRASTSTSGKAIACPTKTAIFPDGTGLSDKVSDIVGRSEFRFRDFVKLTHRFRLDKDNFAIRRNEIDATVGSRGTYVQAGYLRLNRDIGANIEDLPIVRKSGLPVACGLPAIGHCSVPRSST
jgi:LPS-assembly protein